jgi:hypothetical protein
MMKIEQHHWQAIAALGIAFICAGIAGEEFLKMRQPDVIIPNPSMTRKGMLSAYAPDLAGTNGDTPYYLFDSGQPGGSVLVLGGTHPNEAAGFLAAVTMIEQVRVTRGRIFVIPQACLSGYSATEPLEGYPQQFSIPTRTGERFFRYGSRGANPLDSWPDPLVYLHVPSGQQLSGNETRNLNRSYPGRLDGSIMERVAYGILQLLEKEHIDLAFDLHEAAPEIPIINAVVVHEKARDLGGAAVMNLEFEGLQYALELSPANFHGLSHREWGDRLPVMPVLMETSNPVQGRLRGVTNEALIVKGNDVRYRTAADLGKMRITYDLNGEPIEQRVGRHLQGIKAVLDADREQRPEKSVVVEALPSYADVMTNGLGTYFRSLDKTIIQ